MYNEGLLGNNYCNFQYQLIKRKRYVFKDDIFEK